jgi:hypothetical protein
VSDEKKIIENWSSIETLLEHFRKNDIHQKLVLVSHTFYLLLVLKLMLLSHQTKIQPPTQ